MVFNNERMVDIVAMVRCLYKVGMRRRPHFHQQTQNMTSADIVHEFQAYSHLGEKGGGGGGGGYSDIFIHT